MPAGFAVRLGQRTDQQLSASGVLGEVGAELRGDRAAWPARSSENPSRAASHSASRRPSATWVISVTGTGGGDVHRHRVMVTRVPLPGADWMENSFDRRRAPLSPSPSPPPVV